MTSRTPGRWARRAFGLRPTLNTCPFGVPSEACLGHFHTFSRLLSELTLHRGHLDGAFGVFFSTKRQNECPSLQWKTRRPEQEGLPQLGRCLSAHPRHRAGYGQRERTWAGWHRASPNPGRGQINHQRENPEYTGVSLLAQTHPLVPSARPHLDGLCEACDKDLLVLRPPPHSLSVHSQSERTNFRLCGPYRPWSVAPSFQGHNGPAGSGAGLGMELRFSDP